MTLAIHPTPLPGAWIRRIQPIRVGDAVAHLAQRYATAMNASEFATALRARRLSRRSYVAFIAAMYPVVVGFNRALIRSIAKVDHVRNSTFVRSLAEQLEEEQAHNQLWRAMLDAHGVDHEALYNDVEAYLREHDGDELDRCTRDTLAAARRDLGAGKARRSPHATFPDAVLALCHHLWQSASDPAIQYWQHFASQAGIEMVIFDVVTRSILPGVVGHADLDLGAASTRWWLEHGTPPDAPEDHRTDEEKHLALSRAALNRSEAANAASRQVLARAEDTMRLFAAALITQDPERHAFPIERYLRTQIA